MGPAVGDNESVGSNAGACVVEHLLKRCVVDWCRDVVSPSLLNSRGRWIVGVILYMEEDWARGVGCGGGGGGSGCYGIVVGGGFLNGFLEQGKQFVRLVASGFEPVVEVLCFGVSVVCVRAKSVDTKQESKDNASEQAWGVGGMGWNIQVEVHRLFIERCGDGTTFGVKGDGEVHVIDLSAQVSERPCEAGAFIHLRFELNKGGGVCGICLSVEAYHVIYKAFVKEKSRGAVKPVRIFVFSY